MLKLETETSGVRSAALVGAPIDVRSALNRTSSATVGPTVGGRRSEAAAGAETETDDDDSPDWPPPDIEDAMSAEAAGRDGGGGGRSAPARRPRRDDVDTLDGGPLPELGELLKLVPASLQEQLDDLFRAKFQAVKRVPAAVLKVNQEEERPAGGGAIGVDADEVTAVEDDDE